MLCIKCGFKREEGKRCKNCKYLLNKKYVNENLDKIKKYQKEYAQEHKVELNERSLNYYYNNQDRVKQYQKENDTKIREYKNEYERNRNKMDPAFKLRKNCSRLINRVLNGSKNGQSILKHLSYTMKELKDHLEKQFDSKMSWDNYGSYWHIDHIYPQSLLPYTSMFDDNFQKCWALSNLRPLEATENMRKSNKLVEILCL